MPSIPDDTIREVRERARIEDIVREYVQLEKKGRRLVGRCPFHAERTPSFGVAPDKQLFHCFGCQAGGDVFAFVMRIEGRTFPESVRWLAERVGVELPEDRDPAEAKRQRLRSLQLETNRVAADLFQQHLAREPEARTYLTDDRGLRTEAIDAFRVGFAPDTWQDLSDALEAKKLDRVGHQLGLLGKRSSDGRSYDRFRGKVMFPIEASDGAVLGFGARRADWLSSDGPKYLNSPDGPVYDKSTVLYGLRQSHKVMRHTRQALLVEGYLDVIALWQADFRNAVASCGTALTEKHAERLARLVEEVVTLYDGDAAGQAATWKATRLLLAAGLDVRVVMLPEGDDPDTYVRSAGPDALRARIEAAPAALDYFVEDARRAAGGGGVAGMTRAVDRIRPLVLSIADPLRRDVALQAVARRLNLAPRILQKHLSAGRPRGPVQKAQPAENSETASSVRPTIVEMAVLRGLLDSPEAVIKELETRKALDAFTSVAFQAAVLRIVQEIRSGHPVSGPRALELLEAAGVKEGRALADIRKTLTEDLPASNDIAVLVTRLLAQHREHKLRTLRKQIESEPSPERRTELEEELAAAAREILSS